MFAGRVVIEAGSGQAGVRVCTLDQAVPEIAIHAPGRDQQHCSRLLKPGAIVAISETLEASLQIGAVVLDIPGVFEEDISALIDSLRSEYYG